jgi:hypothetical protein
MDDEILTSADDLAGGETALETTSDDADEGYNPDEFEDSDDTETEDNEQPTEESPARETASAPVIPSSTPTVVRRPTPGAPSAFLTPERVSALEDSLGLTPDQAQMVVGLIGEVAQHFTQTQQVTNAHLSEIQTDAPDYYRKNAAQLTQVLSTLPPHQQADRKNVLLAAFGLAVMEHPDDNLPQLVERLYKEMNGKKAALQTPRQTPATQPVARTSVQPTTNSVSRTPQRRNAAPSSSVADYLQSKGWIDRNEAELVASQAKRRKF